jgi:electron transport complex protein RnfG
MAILESRETPGLGDKIYKDAAFVANFDSLSIDPEIVTVKKGRKSAPNEVDAITGATISSKAVARIIQQGNLRWAPRLESHPPAPRETTGGAAAHTGG